jgi:hypothetical protein
VAPPRDKSSFTPLLDEWIEEVGEAQVAAHLEETRHRVEAGTLPTFDNPAELLAFLRQGRKQSA